MMGTMIEDGQDGMITEWVCTVPRWKLEANKKPMTAFGNHIRVNLPEARGNSYFTPLSKGEQAPDGVCPSDAITRTKVTMTLDTTYASPADRAY
jgi:hypothetical protein